MTNLESTQPIQRLAFTLAEAAKASGISKSSLYRAERRGQLRFRRVGGRTLVTVADLEAMLLAA